MKKHYVLFFTLLCFQIFLFACGGEAGPANGPKGEAITDKDTRPGGSAPNGTRPWAADQNLINPNLFDEITSPLNGLRFPSNNEFVKIKGLKSLEIRSYTEADNEALSSDMKELGLNMSRRQTSTFNEFGENNGYLDERFLGAGDPVTSKLVEWNSFSLGEDGETGMISFDEKVGNKHTTHSLAYNLDFDGHMIEAEGEGFLQVFHWEDAANSIRYIAYKISNAPVRMYVVGDSGKWDDLELAIDIDDDIKRKELALIDYDKIGAVPSEVVFLEWKDRRTLKEFQVDHKGLRVNQVLRSYSPEGNILERSFYWDDSNANLRTRTKFKYAPNGDLEEVLRQRQKFNDDMIITIDRYFYDDNGLLSKHIQTSRVNQGAEVVDLLEFVTCVTESASDRATAVPQPSGTR
jgi:hypothetical protein